MLGLATGTTKTRDNHTYASSIAFDFDGSADAVIIPDNADFNHDTGAGYSRFTLSLWFKHQTGSGTLSDTETLAARWDLNDKREWFIYLETDRYIKVAVSDDGSSGGNIKTGTSTFQVSDTNWHHLYFTYDGNQGDEEKRALLIIDGTTVLNLGVGTPSGANFATLHQVDQDTYIGATHNNGTAERHFNGSVDEVCYWKGLFYKVDKVTGAKFIYNNGRPRDMRYAGRGDGGAPFIGYWKMGEFYTAGCPIPSGTFPVTTTNPHDSSKYNGSCPAPLLALNYAGGAPVRTGANLITNGNFADGGPALAVDETDETVNGWQSYTSSTGAVVTTDTSIYRSEGKSTKITTDANGTFVRVGRNTNASLEDGECYVMEYWFYSPTDSSDNAGQEWARTQCEVDECIEADAQYGLSGNGNVVQTYIKINQWTRVIVAGKYNKGSDAAEMAQVSRNFGNLDSGEGPAIFYYDDISLHKITGTLHGLVQSPGTATLDDGVG